MKTTMMKTNLLDFQKYKPGLVIQRRLQYQSDYLNAKKKINSDCLTQDNMKRRVLVLESTPTVDKLPRLNISSL